MNKVKVNFCKQRKYVVITLIILVPAKITDISGNQTVTEGYAELNLNCSATGYPVPNITWTRLFDSSVVTMPLMNIGRQDGGGYRCTANNGAGWPAFKDVFINVQCEYYFYLFTNLAQIRL